MHRSRWTERDKILLRMKFNAGWSDEAIGKHMGRSGGAIRRMRVELGLKHTRDYRKDGPDLGQASRSKYQFKVGTLARSLDRNFQAELIEEAVSKGVTVCDVINNRLRELRALTTQESVL